MVDANILIDFKNSLKKLSKAKNLLMTLPWHALGTLVG